MPLALAPGTPAPRGEAVRIARNPEPGRARAVVALARAGAPVASFPLMDPDDLDDLDDFDALEEEFPLGDGTADTGAIVACPWCGEQNEIAVDPGGGEDQEYTEDCQVCCRPWRVHVRYGVRGDVTVEVEEA